MRIISQNGEVDFPYERIVVMRNLDNVIAVTDELRKKQIVLGRYSSAEKAEKAVGMLRDAYRQYTNLRVCLNGIGNTIVSLEGNEENNQIAIDCRESLMESSYFRFSQDSEVEV